MTDRHTMNEATKIRSGMVYFALPSAFVILYVSYLTLHTSDGLLFQVPIPGEKHTDEKDYKSAGPSLEHEVSRRKVERTSLEFWLFLRSELNQLKTQTNDHSSKTEINQLLAKCNGYQTMLRYDFVKLANEVDNLTDWRLKESLKVGNLVQRRLEFMQNPRDCETAKVLLCFDPRQDICGFACQIHYRTFCLIMAYATKRTLVPSWSLVQPVFKPSSTCTGYNKTSIGPWTADGKQDHVQTMTIDPFIKSRPVFLPPSVPEDIAERLERFHDNPSVWWICQFVKYLTRPRDTLKSFYSTKKKSLGFELPIVGVHIRRTDKKREAPYHKVEEYMMYVDEWFNMYEARHPGSKRRVFLASDDPGVLQEAQAKYDNYTFITDAEVAQSAINPRTRHTANSLHGILQDIHLLSLCNFVVCTFSSNVCRAVYETMQTMHGDASQYVKSLDNMYYFWGQHAHIVEAVEAHTYKSKTNTLELLPGDRIAIGSNDWNGYSSGKNMRTGKKGLFPSYKTVDTVVRVKMPTYPEVKEMP